MKIMQKNEINLVSAGIGSVVFCDDSLDEIYFKGIAAGGVSALILDNILRAMYPISPAASFIIKLSAALASPLIVNYMVSSSMVEHAGVINVCFVTNVANATCPQV